MSYCEIYWSEQPNTTEVAITAGTPVKVPGDTQVNFSTPELQQDADNRIKYTGDDTCVMEVIAHISGDNTGGSAGDFLLCIAKNGVVIPSSLNERRIATGNAVGCHGSRCLLEMDPGDYVELFVDCSASTDFTTKYGVLRVQKMRVF